MQHSNECSDWFGSLVSSVLETSYKLARQYEDNPRFNFALLRDVILTDTRPDFHRQICQIFAPFVDLRFVPVTLS